MSDDGHDDVVQPELSDNDSLMANNLWIVLKARCEISKISIIEDEDYSGEKYYELQIPRGRSHRSFRIPHSPADLQRLLDTEFEKYRFTEGFDAIYSFEKLEIEALIKQLNSGVAIPSSRLLKYISSDNGSPILLTPNGIEGPKIEISEISKIARAFNLSRMSIYGSSRELSIKIFGFPFTNHDEVLTTLERITNSIFFQIDLLNGIPLSLTRERRTRSPFETLRFRRSVRTLTFPNTEYDPAPISLYWYARGAAGMPLLRFLAYYQTLEFYFPTYSTIEASRRIRSILKDPAFRGERDVDIRRIITVIQRGRSIGGADERSQLRATIIECLDAGELREFIEENEDRKAFLSSKAKGLTDHKIPVGNNDADLRNDVADRIYDIRCKIVHTKGAGAEIELLLPFSKEADQLIHDIELVEFLAQKVLIAASSSLSM